MKKKNIYITAAAAVGIAVVSYLFFTGDTSAPVEVSESMQKQEVSRDTTQGTQAAGATKTPRAPKTAPSVPQTSPSVTVQAVSEPQITYTNTSDKDISVTAPKPGQKVSSGITVSGTARSDWFYKDIVSVEVLSASGDSLVRNNVKKGGLLANGTAQFSSLLIIPSNYRGPATIVVRNDNPPSHPIPDRSVSIPVVVE